MKPVNTPKTVDVMEEEEPKKVPQTRPLTAKFIKCIWTGPVNVFNAPSGKEYRFAPGQTLPVELLDYHWLLSLKRNPGPGCCAGGPAQDRFYFEAGG